MLLTYIADAIAFSERLNKIIKETVIEIQEENYVSVIVSNLHSTNREVPLTKSLYVESLHEKFLRLYKLNFNKELKYDLELFKKDYDNFVFKSILSSKNPEKHSLILLASRRENKDIPQIYFCKALQKTLEAK